MTGSPVTSETPLGDRTQNEWLTATQLAFNRGVLTEQDRILKIFDAIKDPSESVKAVRKEIFGIKAPTPPKNAKLNTRSK